jgi:hypothetical protein
MLRADIDVSDKHTTTIFMPNWVGSLQRGPSLKLMPGGKLSLVWANSNGSQENGYFRAKILLSPQKENGDVFLQNVCIHQQDSTMSQPRGNQFVKSPMRNPKNSLKNLILV